MKRNRLFNKIVSLTLVMALYLTMSASAYAELDSDITSAEPTPVEVQNESAEPAANQEAPVDVAAPAETPAEPETPAEGEDPSNPVIEKIKEIVDGLLSGDDAETPEDSQKEGEATEEEPTEEEPTDEVKEEEAAAACKYESNNDGTHKVIREAEEEEGEPEEFIESCEFDEAGVCTKCGYHRLPDPILTYEDWIWISQTSRSNPYL